MLLIKMRSLNYHFVNAHLLFLLQGRSDTSDSVIREMQQTSMNERRSVTETNQQKGRTVYKDIYV